MSDYYPEFYLRKRQREQNYRRLTVVAVGFLVLLVVFGVVGYIAFNAFATRQTPPGATPELAEQQQQLQTAEQLASSSVPADVLENTEEQPKVDLSSVSYSESFPQVDVKLAGASAKPEGEANTVPAEGELPPAVGRDGEATGDGDVTSAPVTDSTTDDGTAAPQPSEQDSRVGSVTPSDDDAQRKADQLKRQEQARREAEKREAKKKADEKKKRELAKQKQKDDELVAAKKKEEDAAKPKDDVRAPATKSGGYSYTVYGGTYLSSEEAEKDRAKLGAIGLSGNVIKAAGDYLLLVGRLDDKDAAAALSGKLKGSGFGSSFVTRKAK